MGNVIDLSEIRNKKAAAESEAPDFESLTDEQKAAVEALAAEHQPEVDPDAVEVRTAFLVVIGKDGHAMATSDLTAKIVREHMPSTYDMYGAVMQVAKDIQTSEAAQLSAIAFQQMMQAQMQQMQNAQLANRLNLPK